SFPQGIQFSPDGTCLLTAKANRLELYNTPYDDDDDENDDGDNGNKESNEQHRVKNKDDKDVWEPVITCAAGETVRAYTWYPHMKSSDPATCCFAAVSRDSPVHLYDAYDGSIRASYCPYNGLDEMESPTTLCFVENGTKLVTGGLRTDRLLHIFDINRPGRDHVPPTLKLGKTRRSKDGQKGLVSAMAYSEHRGVIAIGTYSPGSIYLYDLRTYSKSAVAEVIIVCVVGHGQRGKKNNNNKRKRFNNPNDPSSGVAAGVDNSSPSMNFSAAKRSWFQTRTRGGVTQVEFDDGENGMAGGGDGHYLFSTSRRSNAILQWDLRKLSSSNYCPGIARFEVDNDTNQRIEFQIHGDQIWTGGRDGCVRVYSYRTSTSETTKQLISDMNDESNGDEDHNNSSDIGMKKSLLAVAIGTRHFPSENDWDSEEPHTSLTNRTND
ncbi:WD40 repeat-like protein, partial [Fragilariopsis cylindrus CCMP1102]